MAPTPWSPNSYPPTRRSDHVDVYQSASKGTVEVPDPYQWMEDNNSDEVSQWTTAQSAFTQAYIDKNPDRQKLEDKFRASKDYAKFSAPTLLDNGYWYWFYNDGKQSQSVLYRSKEAARPDFSKRDDEIGEVFFNPNLHSTDGTAIMSTCRFSPCGTYFAYAMSHLGGDYTTIYVRLTSSPLSQASVAEGGDARLLDEVKWSKFSTIMWSKDSKGFIYQRYPPREQATMHGDKGAMMSYHRIGTQQEEDIVVYEDKENPDRRYNAETSEDGKYIYLVQYKDSSKLNLLWVAEIDTDGIKPNFAWRKVIDEFKADFHVVTNHGTLVYVKTNWNAPRHKVIAIDLSADEPQISDFIPEQKDATLSQVKCVNKEYFVVIYKRNVKDEVYLYSKAGVQLGRLAPELVGSASITNREKHPHFFITLSGFDTPGTIASYDFTAPEEQRLSILRTTKVNGLNPDDFESTQVWYESKDGAKIPMFIVRHKSTKFDGTAAAIQYGYGGFAICSDPFFSPIILTFLQTYGAILAVPNIRGGGEFGEGWHRQGRRETKGNSFDDFIAAAQFLVKEKYAAPGKIAISGVSNGGYLVCGTLVRAPEGVFGAAISEGGPADQLKFDKFTGGKSWKSDYGDPSSPEDFDFIQTLSPVHNVPTGRVLPATLMMTNAGDDRVVPMHSYKFIASLQHNLPDNPNPLLIRVDKSWLGHGFGKTSDKHTADAADKWGFVVQALGLKWQSAD